MAYFISDTVDSLNLNAFQAQYAGGDSRNQAFHPAMLVKVLVYAYASEVFSSRKIAKKLHEEVAFRVLGADNFLAHRTIRDFRALHLNEFTELCTQVVRRPHAPAGRHGKSCAPADPRRRVQSPSRKRRPHNF